jgi:tetratricopeptide (TPR) repeat protein/TolB-like protein
MRRWLPLFLLCCSTDIAAARLSLAVFPLVNSTGDPLAEWAAPAVPEYFARSLSAVEGIRVWDPLFMFQTDSSGWNMRSDSLLQVHQLRWQWDAAIGGAFSIAADSLHVNLQVIKAAGTKQRFRMDIARSAKVDGCQELMASLVEQVCVLLRFDLSTADSFAIRQEAGIMPPAYRTYCAGYGFEMRGDYAEALTAYNRAAELSPSLTIACCRLGRLYFRSGNTPRSLEFYRRAESVKQQTPLTRAMEARGYVEMYPPDKSFRYVKMLQRELGKSAGGLTVLGKQYLTAGEYQRAIAAFQRAIAWGASDLDAEFLLGTTFLWSGEYAAGIELFNRLISMRPDYVRYHVSLGAMYRTAGMLMESQAVLEAIKKRNPDNVMVMVETAHTFFALGWNRKAAQLLEQALQLKPDQTEILIDLGVVYWHENRKREAEACFRQASLRREGMQPYYVNTGDIAFASGSIDRAIAAYRSAERIGGKNPAILYNLAVAYRRKGDKRQSARFLDELLLLTPGRTDLLLERAALALDLGKTDDAERAYRHVLEYDPYQETASVGLVKRLISRGAFDEAIARIEKYLAVMPARSDFYALLAETYRARGWHEVALEKYQIVMKDFPDYGEAFLGAGRCMYDLIRLKGSTRYDEALYVLKQASQLSPENPEPQLLMGEIYFEYKGYRELAVEQWRAALRNIKDDREKRLVERKIAGAEAR